MIPKNDLVRMMKQECATTLKVMRAYPAGQAAFKPHDRSSDALQLMSTFVFEMWLLRSNLLDDSIEPAAYASYSPDGVAAVIADFERESADTVSRIEALSDEGYGKAVSFAEREFQVSDFAIMMLHDQIHHRGQLSVYVRMAGGLVPAIYGPSADDTVTNL